jgi:hypothetical protein
MIRPLIPLKPDDITIYCFNLGGLLMNKINEAELFQEKKLWEGGFIDADPLLPLSGSSYGNNGFVSIYHATYLACIKPYINEESVVIEIGPGRGAWTKAILHEGASKVYAVDVYDRLHNGIDIYVGDNANKIVYIQTANFDLQLVPNNSATYFFSFGALVHLSMDAQREYFRALFEKLKSNAMCFIQVADIDRWNEVVSGVQYRITDCLKNRVSSRLASLDFWGDLSGDDSLKARESIAPHIADNNEPNPGRYFFHGVKVICEELKACGYKVLDDNYIPSLRDPIIKFIKP